MCTLHPFFIHIEGSCFKLTGKRDGCCELNVCQDVGGNCYCDSACFGFADCCPDIAQTGCGRKIEYHYYYVTNELIINIMNIIKVALIMHSAADGNFNASVTTTSSCGNFSLQKNLK